jgi:hypothetical protein
VRLQGAALEDALDVRAMDIRSMKALGLSLPYSVTSGNVR